MNPDATICPNCNSPEDDEETGLHEGPCAYCGSDGHSACQCGLRAAFADVTTDDEARAAVEKVLAEQRREQDERGAATLAAPVHIRRRIARKRGNGFYRVQYSASENGSQTLCGAAAGIDRSWAEARFPKHLAAVTCGTCKQIRATQS